MVTRFAGLAAGLLLCVCAYAQTADECIAEYEGLRETFETAPGFVAAEVQLSCAQEGHIIALDAEGVPNVLPDNCLALLRPEAAKPAGVEDHWHLQAKAILGPNPACIVQLLGFTGDALEAHPECGTTGEPIPLPANEGAKWRNYLREQCPKEEGEE